MKCEDKEYLDYLLNRNSFKKLIRKFLLKKISKKFRGKVLDVGCGIGEFLEIYPNSVGCDINKNVLEYCRKKNLKAFYCDIEKNVPTDSYDGVFFSNVLEHIKNYVEALNNIDKILKKKGIFILLLPNKKGFENDKTHNPKFDYKDVFEWLKNNGYEIKISYLLKYNFPVRFNDMIIICKKC